MFLENKFLTSKIIYGVLPYCLLILTWGMNLTALPGLLILWWIKKQGFLKLIESETLITLGKSQLIISLTFMACFIISTELEKEIKHFALSDDHFLPLLFMLPVFFAYALKILAITMLLVKIYLFLRSLILKKV
jgi:hypothetical protein